MRPDREHPLYHLDAETLLVATYIWVDDALKALQAQGIRFPKPQRHQKATLPELLTIALFLTFIGLDLSKGYLLSQALLRPYFPSLPHLSRFLRVLQNAQSLLAHLALRLAQGPSLLHVVDLKPLPMAHGHRIRGYALPGSGVGVGPLGGFAGYALVGVINDRGLFHRWALLPGNARETWARELLEGLEHVLGDRGFRWVEGVLTPPYRLRGGQVVETGWRGWMGRVRNWIETRFSVMVRSFGLHRMEARSYWGLVARVNLILLAHNLVRSRVLLEMAGVEL
ncbi:transposase [Thermus caliditerrae]|uniref:transposase n=1 Tax=Thermus caliditerrae TaxID=1330700 RepID=UPI000571B28A|nr:transposase [Thermus caliditerrae]